MASEMAKIACKMASRQPRSLFDSSYLDSGVPGIGNPSPPCARHGPSRRHRGVLRAGAGAGALRASCPGPGSHRDARRPRPCRRIRGGAVLPGPPDSPADGARGASAAGPWRQSEAPALQRFRGHVLRGLAAVRQQGRCPATESLLFPGLTVASPRRSGGSRPGGGGKVTPRGTAISTTMASDEWAGAGGLDGGWYQQGDARCP
ncbi:unnamed protein product [Prorocentrum cordatum]|uniref:Uncharacterized protein n=1 Tax=Prorocentrum cordatum TaxID=2364126 RepID=A0ABN9TH42_9DINO|nr:unnamed protein product [Polarella glacialis]